MFKLKRNNNNPFPTIKTISPNTWYGTALLFFSAPFIVITLIWLCGSAIDFNIGYIFSNHFFDVFLIYILWILFQAGLYILLPGKTAMGQTTPAGYNLHYTINGLCAWAITMAVYLFNFNLISSFLVANWWGLFIAANICGAALALIAYAKGYWIPSHRGDCTYSNSRIYDFFMGIEFNPRFGNFDFKLFFNGRPGIIAWTLINLSFAHHQYITCGTVTNSMILVNIFQLIYVVDFFYHEAWYLKTIDIAHEHFGFMLAWGDLVWLPFIYTLQAQYLAYNPVKISSFGTYFVTALFIIGYFIFRSANNQKDRFKENPGSVKIWGRTPDYIACYNFVNDIGTEDNNTSHTRKSRLLVSGFWGLLRHANYLGDLIMSLCFGLACGLPWPLTWSPLISILPYFYFCYMTILLVHRCLRDEVRCGNKYRGGWREYCAKVPWRIVPYVF